MTGGVGEEARRRALEWLRPKLEPVPEELAEAVRDCVRRTGTGAAAEEPPGGAGGAGSDREVVPALLARAAVEEFDRVDAGRQDREAAVRLLAADASLTYAFEAAAELEADVPELADAVGLQGRIGERLAGIMGGEEAATPGGAGPSDGERQA